MQSDAWKSREALIKPLSLRFRGVIPRCWHCASNSAKWLLAGGFWNPPERGPWPFNSNSTRVRLIVEVHVVVNDIVVVQDVSCCFVAAPHKTTRLQVNPIFRRSYFLLHTREYCPKRGNAAPLLRILSTFSSMLQKGKLLRLVDRFFLKKEFVNCIEMCWHICISGRFFFWEGCYWYFCRVRSKEVEIFSYFSCYVNNDFNLCCFDLYYILSFSDLYGRWQFGKV